MRLLGDRRTHHVQDQLWLENHLVTVESEHGVTAQAQSSVSLDVAPSILGAAVMGESVQLDREAITDQGIQRVPVDPHLLDDDHPDRAHQDDEVGLEPGIGQDVSDRSDA